MSKRMDNNNSLKFGELLNEELDSSFPLKSCTSEKEMLEATKQWAKRFKLIQIKEDEEEFDRDRIVLFGIYSCPEAKGDRLLVAAIFAYWLFRYDDYCEDAAENSNLKHLKEVSNKFAQIMVNPPQTTEGLSPLEISFLDLMDMCRRMSSEAWVRRLQISWYKWNVAIYRERQLKEAKLAPSLKEYLDNQGHTSGGDVQLDIVELTYNIYTPEDFIYSQVMQDLRRSAVRILRYANDLYSYEKEKDTGNYNNIVAVIISEFGLTKDDAIRRAIQMYSEEIKELLRFEKTIPSYDPETDETIKSVIRGIKVCLRGNLAFYERSDRYGYHRPGTSFITSVAQ